MLDRPDHAAASAPDDSVARLCALYDARLAEGGPGLSDGERAELKALAGVFDLDADRPDPDVWRDVRAVVTRQTARRPDPAASADGAPALAGRAERPLTVLLVEDDPELAADLTEILTTAGHGVVGPFHNAAAAEAGAAQGAFDVALLDLNLSDGPAGVDLARGLKAKWGTPAIFVSGDVTLAARHAELATALVIKPYTGAQILAALEQALPAPAGEAQA